MIETSTDKLKEVLYATLAGVADGSIPIDRAKAVCDVSSQIIDIQKTQVQALAIVAKADNPTATKELVSGTGLLKLNR